MTNLFLRTTRRKLHGGSARIVVGDDVHQRDLAGVDGFLRALERRSNVFGFFHVLAMATERYVPENRVILAGARDLDPGEAERVQDRLRHIRPENLPFASIPDLGPWYVHVDVDVLDPKISRA